MPDTRVPVAGFAGINLRDNPRSLQPGEALMTRNLVPSKFNNQLIKRDEVVRQNYINASSFIAVTLNKQSILLGSTPIYGELITYGAPGSYAIGAGSVVDINGNQFVYPIYNDPTSGATSSVQLSDAGYNPAPAVFAPFTKYMLVFPGKPSGLRPKAFSVGGTKYPFYYADVTATGGVGFVSATFGGTGNGSVLPAGGCQYLNRMVYWNIADNYESSLLFSDDAAMLTISAGATPALGSRDFPIGSRAEGPIVSCVPISLSTVSVPAQQALLVLKENATYLVTGQPQQTTNTPDPITGILGTLQVSKINIQTTCVSHASVVQTPSGVIWCGRDDVWAFEIGTAPRRIGTKLSPMLLKRIPQMGTEQPFIHGQFDGQFYRLTLCADPTENNPYRLFGEMQDQFRLNIMNGIPQDGMQNAQWFGPHQFRVSKQFEDQPAPSFFTSFQNPTVPIQNSSGSSIVSIYPVTMDYGDGLGITTKLNTFTEVGGQDGAGLGMDRTTGSNVPVLLDTGTAIISEIRSGMIDDGDVGTDEIYTGLEVSGQFNPAFLAANDVRANLDTPLDIVVNLHGQGSTSYSTTTNLTPALTLGAQFQLDSSNLDSSTMTAEYVNKLVYPDCNIRPVGRTMQVQFKDVSAWQTNVNFRQFVVEWQNPGNFITVPLTPGLYPTLTAYLNYLCGILSGGLIPLASFSHTFIDQTVGFANGGYQIQANQNWRPSTADASTLNILKLIYFAGNSFSYTMQHNQSSSLPNISQNFSTRWGIENLILRYVQIPRLADGT